MGPADVAVHNLRIDHVTAQVLRAFQAAGVSSILLKGPSTARWLYGNRPRRYQDCDLLVSPAAIDAAERVLADLGFAPALRRREMPAWWRDHAVEWAHREQFAAVDLHHTLKGVDVDDARVWEALAAETETMAVGGFDGTVLTLPGRALVLALDNVGDGVAKRDLARAVELVDDETWGKAARLASALDATDAFAAGLRLAHGDGLAARLGLPPAQSVETTLRATHSAPGALTIERLARASGPLERLAIIRHKLLPPPTFMRHWSYRAQAGRLALLGAYGRRLVWVVRKAPRALRAWRRARRTAHQEPSPRA